MEQHSNGGDIHNSEPRLPIIDELCAEAADQPAPTARLPPRAALPRIAIRPLAEYEPPLVHPLPKQTSVLADLPRPLAFQLQLDLEWARDHRLERSEDEITPAEVQAIRHLLTAMVEVLDRRRPLEQLEDHVTPMVYAALATRAHHSDAQHSLWLRSVHLCQPVKGIIEACGTLSYGHRALAVAARLEAREHSWLCTVLQLVLPTARS